MPSLRFWARDANRIVRITQVCPPIARPGGRYSSTDANTTPDAKGVGTSTPSLWAERSGGGDGRVYQLAFTATDGHGGACQGLVKVTVPHDQSGRRAVDGGPRHDSTTT